MRQSHLESIIEREIYDQAILPNPPTGDAYDFGRSLILTPEEGIRLAGHRRGSTSI